jgi:hypothetical protein
MRGDQHRFLTLLGLVPARLTAEQVPWILNCQSHDLPILVSAGLLKPLRNAPRNSVKYFAALDVLKLVKDRTCLAKVTNTVNELWRDHKARKRRCGLVLVGDSESKQQAPGPDVSRVV